MEEKDLQEVAALYAKYMERFDMRLEFTEEEVRHHFLSGRGKGPGDNESWKKPRPGQVVWTYVVEVILASYLLQVNCRAHMVFPT